MDCAGGEGEGERIHRRGVCFLQLDLTVAPHTVAATTMSEMTLRGESVRLVRTGP